MANKERRKGWTQAAIVSRRDKGEATGRGGRMANNRLKKGWAEKQHQGVG